jgi:hypothetical protein
MIKSEPRTARRLRVRQVDPGHEKSMTFKVLVPDLYVYHCATPMVAEHIASLRYIHSHRPYERPVAGPSTSMKSDGNRALRAEAKRF